MMLLQIINPTHNQEEEAISSLYIRGQELRAILEICLPHMPSMVVCESQIIISSYSIYGPYLAPVLFQGLMNYRYLQSEYMSEVHCVEPGVSEILRGTESQ